MAFPQKLSAKIFHQTFSTNFPPTKFPQQFCQMFSTCLLKAWIFEFRSLLGLVWTVFGFTVILIIFWWFGDWRCGWTWLILSFRSWRLEHYIILDGKLKIFNANARNSFSFSYSDGVRMNLVVSDPCEKTTKALRRAVPTIWQVIKFLSNLKDAVM